VKARDRTESTVRTERATTVKVWESTGTLRIDIIGHMDRITAEEVREEMNECADDDVRAVRTDHRGRPQRKTTEKESCSIY